MKKCKFYKIIMATAVNWAKPKELKNVTTLRNISILKHLCFVYKLDSGDRYVTS